MFFFFQVIRNLKLTFYLLPEEGGASASDGTYDAAVRVIKKLSEISEDDFIHTFHVIHNNHKLKDKNTKNTEDN